MSVRSILRGLLNRISQPKQSSEKETNTVLSDDQQHLESCYRQLAALLSQDASAVSSSLDSLFTDPLAYLQELGYGMLEDESFQDLLWLGLANVLESHDYLLIRDSSDELEDFSYFYDQLKSVQRSGLYLANLGLELDETQELFVWLEQLADGLTATDYLLGTMAIESDSYHILICKRTILPQIMDLVACLNQAIDFY